MSDRYYLNNTSTETIQIALTKIRNIKPMSSLALNDKDLTIFRKLQLQRRGRQSKLDLLKISKIKIENDANYNEEIAKEVQKAAEKDLKAQKALQKKLEEQAKEEEAKRMAEKRAAVAELIKEEALKNGKEVSEEDLEDAVTAFLEEESRLS